MEEIKIKSRVNYVLVSLISLAFAVVLAPIIKLFVYVTELILAIAYHPNAHVKALGSFWSSVVFFGVFGVVFLVLYVINRKKMYVITDEYVSDSRKEVKYDEITSVKLKVPWYITPRGRGNIEIYSKNGTAYHAELILKNIDNPNEIYNQICLRLTNVENPERVVYETKPVASFWDLNTRTGAIMFSSTVLAVVLALIIFIAFQPATNWTFNLNLSVINVSYMIRGTQQDGSAGPFIVYFLPGLAVVTIFLNLLINWMIKKRTKYFLRRGYVEIVSGFWGVRKKIWPYRNFRKINIKMKSNNLGTVHVKIPHIRVKKGKYSKFLQRIYSQEEVVPYGDLILPSHSRQQVVVSQAELEADDVILSDCHNPDVIYKIINWIVENHDISDEVLKKLMSEMNEKSENDVIEVKPRIVGELLIRYALAYDIIAYTVLLVLFGIGLLILISEYHPKLESLPSLVQFEYFLVGNAILFVVLFFGILIYRIISQNRTRASVSESQIVVKRGRKEIIILVNDIQSIRLIRGKLNEKYNLCTLEIHRKKVQTVSKENRVIFVEEIPYSEELNERINELNFVIKERKKQDKNKYQ